MKDTPATNTSLAGNFSFIAELRRRHPPWYFSALCFGALAILCVYLSALDDRTLLGVSVWTKPAKFSVSLAIYFATLAWFAPLLPKGYFKLLRGRLLTWIPIACGLFEIAYITFQASQAEASHFNLSTPFHSTMYGLMANGAELLVLTCLVMGIEILRQHGTGVPYELAVALGLIATALLGGLFGGYMGAQTGHWIGGSQTDAGGLPLFNWSRDGGDLRVAHFFGMHAMQVLPVAAALLTSRLTRRNGVRTVWSLLIGYTAFTSWTFIMALRGIPLIT